MNYYSYGSVENGYNKQLAAAYVVYMIFGSYFKKCRMTNPLEEEHLKAHYMSMKEKLQYEKEEFLDDLSTEVLGALNVEHLTCEVHTTRVKELYCVLFFTGSQDFAAGIDRKGRVRILRIPASRAA